METESQEPPPIQLNNLSHLFEPDWFTLETAIYLCILVLLMMGSALVSGSEIAFFSFKADSLDEFKNSKNKREKKIYELVTQPRQLLATILIANNFFNIGIIVVSSFLVGQIFNFSGFPKWVEVLITLGLVTAIIVLFGEVLPKVYATQRAKHLASFMAAPLGGMREILRPISNLLIKGSANLEERMANDSETISAEEVDLAIDLTTKGKATDDEVQILKSIVRFGDISVKEVMTSRPDIQSFSSELDFKELIQTVRESGFSRIPVFEEDLDKVIGILYAKDLLAYLGEEADFSWQELIREPFFVPENKKIDDLLKDFQENHTHMAIVVDEYGGTAGLATLEDVLEEIIGEIKDEFDDINSDLEYEQLDENRYRFAGKSSLFDVCKLLQIDYSEFEEVKGESDSLAGLLLEVWGKFPKKFQVLQIKNLLFKVTDVDQKRIKTVEVEVLSR